VEKPCVFKIISNNHAFHIGLHTSIQATLIQLSATQSNKTAIKQKMQLFQKTSTVSATLNRYILFLAPSLTRAKTNR